MGPDAAFIRTDRLPPRELRRAYIPVAPDLVVEVISPSQRMRAVLDRVRVYLAHGVRLVWVVHPRGRRVTAYHVDGTTHVYEEHDELDGGNVLPGFRLPLAAILT